MIGGAKGIGIGLDFGIGNQLRPRNSKPYIEQAVLDSLCGVWIADQNTNRSPTRNIIKNKLKDRGGDFEILNAAYKGNSGYGLYQFDWSNWSIDTNEAHGIKVTKEHNKVTYQGVLGKSTNLYNRSSRGVTRFKIKLSDANCGIEVLYKIGGTDSSYIIAYHKRGILYHDIEVPDSEIINIIMSNFTTDSITIEQIPEHKGAFVTDGVDDLIVSQKPVSEMLGNSMDYTVISMTHQIAPNSTYNKFFTNYIHEDSGSNNYNRVDIDASSSNKTGIYGYVSKDGGFTKSCSLGDKADYNIVKVTRGMPRYKFSVQGFTNSSGNIDETSAVAWYWTIIAKIALTEDQINQVIEYFNLDKYVAPDIYYNVKKQGITNENHAEFGDKLIDYSGNGHDMQLYNFGWKLNSGVGKYEITFSADNFFSKDAESDITVRNSKFTVNGYIKRMWLLWTIKALPSYTIKVRGINPKGSLKYFYFEGSVAKTRLYDKDGVYTLPASEASNIGLGFQVSDHTLDWTGLTVEIVPTYEDALVLDGVNDYGKVEGLPILKDYTVVGDYQRLVDDHNRLGGDGPLLSKSYTPNQGAFVFNARAEKVDTGSISYSFGTQTYNPNIEDMRRSIFYQTKYKNKEFNINAGSGIDNDSMTLGIFRSGDTRFASIAMYSAMLFPYSLSKFLIERQLKRHKVGSFYEKDAIIFRPHISTNVPYKEIEIYDYTGGKNNGLLLSNSINKSGTYLPKDNNIIVFIKPNGVDEVSSIIINDVKYENPKININGFYEFHVKLTKSPQVIDITINEYVRFEDMPQFYPAFVTYQDLDGKEYSWGDKLKYESPIKIKTSTNLLPELYKITSYYIDIRGLWQTLTEEQFLNYNFEVGSMESCRSSKRYLLDNNEPKCILSPELLIIPNESYEYLGYIPDISGHGNHGVPVNNSWDSELSGPQSNGTWKLDGVDDFIVINDLSVGGRQMFMKFSYEGNVSLAYDQRTGIENNFAMLVGDNGIAHNARNSGDTYIDGILNKNIISSQLKNVMHNATLTNDIDIDVVSQTPVIGCNRLGTNDFTKMSLYTFMLFDEISTPDKIRELNDIIGVNPKVDVPPYYIDNHGKTNLDADKAQLVNLGNGGEHTLNINNVAYEGMSGYGGYPVVFGANKTWQNAMGQYAYEYTYNSNTAHITKVLTNNAIFYSYKTYAMTANIPSFKIRVTGLDEVETIKLSYYYFANSEATARNIIDITKDGEYTMPESFINDNMAEDHWIGLRIDYKGEAVVPIDCNVIIEVLPDYPNAILLDGVNDNITNATIPALTDFTCIVKREMIGDKINGSSFMNKGKNTTTGGAKNAFMYDYKTASGNYIYSFTNANKVDTHYPISYITSTQADGINIVRGNGGDDVGLMIGKWDVYWKGAFYKLMLYPKTLDILQINMLKNLFELDEKIDINNPIFKK